MAEDTIKTVHEKALQVAHQYKLLEIELIKILQEVDRLKVYYKLGYSSLFKYCTDCLKLSEATSYMFINVSRKASEVPRLQAEISKGHITVSKAKKITSVLTRENQDHWLRLAKEAPQAKLEREVAKVSLKESVRNQMAYVNPQQEVIEKVILKKDTAVRVQLQVGLSEDLMLKVRRAQDILSQKKRSAAGLEEVLQEAIELYIQKYDPLEKAKRQKMRGGLEALQAEKRMEAQLGNERETMALGAGIKTLAQTETETQAELDKKTISQEPEQQVLRPVNEKSTSRHKRKPLSASLKHRVFLKAGGQCTHINPAGKRCRERRFLDIHHIRPLYRGGSDSLENLTLLCSGHHRMVHFREVPTQMR